MRIPISAAILLLAVAPCLAQTFTTTTVDVLLDGCGAVEPQTVTLVPNGNEQGSFTLERIGPGHWRRTDRPAFNARGQSASLRLGGSRTGCETSQELPDPRNPNHWIAVFRFHCTQERYWRKLTVGTKQTTLPLTYLRVMSDSRCAEGRPDSLGTATLEDVAADRESIFVNFGEKVPLAYTNYSLAIFRGSFGKHALTNEPLVVNRDEMITDLTLRLANSGRAEPANAGNARTLRGLDIGNFGPITLTVK